MRTLILYLVITILHLGYSQAEGRHKMVCGWPPQKYDPLQEVCFGGYVFSRPTTSASKNTSITSSSGYEGSESTPVTEQNPSRKCRGKTDLMVCGWIAFCGRQGYKCCGVDVYKPQSQTCCMQASSTYKIHDGKPEKMHICCNLDIYGRSSPNATCRNPSANDKFFRKPKKLRSDNRICHESSYVYRIDITRIKKGHYLTADIGVWVWSPTSNRGEMRMERSPAQTKEINIKLDKYSPTRTPYRKSFLIFSKYNYFKDSILFLRPNEILYKIPKDKQQTARALRKIHENCLVTFVNNVSASLYRDMVNTKDIVPKSPRRSRRKVRKLQFKTW